MFVFLGGVIVVDGGVNSYKTVIVDISSAYFVPCHTFLVVVVALVVTW